LVQRHHELVFYRGLLLLSLRHRLLSLSGNTKVCCPDHFVEF
jgi:hypothetical protein